MYEYILLGILKNMMFHSQVGDSLRIHFSMTFPQIIILQAGTIFLGLGPFPFQIKNLWEKDLIISVLTGSKSSPIENLYQIFKLENYN